MDIAEEILKNKSYKKLVDRLSTNTLELIAKDHLKALKEAHKGIKKEEPERLNDIEYLQAQADAMQAFAKKLLAKRAKKKA